MVRIYKERLTDIYMIRPKIPGGVITLEQLKTINEIAKKYSEDKIQFTTRQDIKFHSLKIEYQDDILDCLEGCGLIRKCTYRDGVRNIVCSPLSGVSQNEIFDVTPYMQEVAKYIIRDSADWKLSRNYKIAFSNSSKDTANAAITDIGFIAKIVNGKKGFEVYGAGGVGRGARVGVKIEDFIEGTEILYYVQTMKQIFEREVDKNSRQKTRLRFVVERFGEEGFRELFRNELDKLREKQNLKLRIDLKEEIEKKITENNKLMWGKEYENIIYPQKQDGYYSVYVHPQNGNVNTQNLDTILEFLTNLSYEVSIRLAMTKGFFVRNLKEKDVGKLLSIISDFCSVFNIERSITCAGSKGCKVGINNSQGLLNSIINVFREATFEIKSALPEILISGCPNSCAQSQRGLIGLFGKKRTTEDGLIPVYSISFNGGVREGGMRFGQTYGEIPAKKIPEFFGELARIKVNSGYMDFVKFIEDKEIEVRKLINKYSSIERISENPDLYIDF